MVLRSPFSFSFATAITSASMARGMTMQPSASPKIRSPGDTRNAGAFDRHVKRDDLAAAFAVERADAAVEDRELHGADIADVADKAIHHRACGAAHLRGGREQRTPRRDAAGRATTEDRNVLRIESVHKRDLELIRIVFSRLLVDIHEERRARSADHDEILVERTNVRGQRLIHVSERIQRIGQKR